MELLLSYGSQFYFAILLSLGVSFERILSVSKIFDKMDILTMDFYLGTSSIDVS